ncbi:DUF445 family protein [Gracilibacillus massiliensis]|uniref:DUF445 family protein n=1 Tax=Gracilibacillus massiliensis TaxID=1564956 RepID=UPI00071D86E5|nr:DUF445 family protein [Gracilibacillus massiliensis]
METLLIILVMVGVGSFIGGLTNSIAIKMLFRPYEAKYIGKWKIPFTPGVIPKRRDQLAKQLGQLVVNHLLTLDSIQKKLADRELHHKVEKKIEKEFDHFLLQSTSIQQLSDKLGINLQANLLKEKIAEKIMEQVRVYLQQHRDKPIKLWLEQAVTEQDIDKASGFIRNKGIDLLNNEETRQKMEQVIQQYAQSKGFLGNMVLSMFSGEELALKVQRLVIEYLSSEEGYQWISRAVHQEWSNLLEQEISIIETVFEKEETQHLLNKLIQEQLPVENWMQKPIQTILVPFIDQIKRKIIPLLTDQLFNKLSTSLPEILNQLEVEKMVENQVSSFPTSRIEEIILSISRKEFKLITYLGALLGGLIGLIQALLFIMI